jgi:hypothetical protein
MGLFRRQKNTPRSPYEALAEEIDVRVSDLMSRSDEVQFEAKLSEATALVGADRLIQAFVRHTEAMPPQQRLGVLAKHLGAEVLGEPLRHLLEAQKKLGTEKLQRALELQKKVTESGFLALPELTSADTITIGLFEQDRFSKASAFSALNSMEAVADYTDLTLSFRKIPDNTKISKGAFVLVKSTGEVAEYDFTVGNAFNVKSIYGDEASSGDHLSYATIASLRDTLESEAYTDCVVGFVEMNGIDLLAGQKA